MTTCDGRRRTIVLLGLLLAAALLILPGLADRYLWDDEAETALLARHTLRFGVPVAWDGRTLVSQECGADYDANYLWRQTPWLPVYMTAASFATLGASTLAARLPFALLGIVAVAAVWALARRWFRDDWTGLVAGSSLLLSVPFLLHARQCRYYSLVVLGTAATLYFLVGVLQHRRASVAGLAVALIVTFHANYFLFFAALSGLALATLALRPDRAAAAGLLAALLVIAVAVTPWLALFDVAGHAPTMLRVRTPGEYLRSLAAYLTRIELQAFPALLLAAVLTLAMRRSLRDIGSPAGRRAVALILFALGWLLVVALRPQDFFRYLLGLLPVFAVLQAAALRALWSRHRALAVAVAVLAVAPDRAAATRGSLELPLLRYIDEVTWHTPGPIEAIVKHLGAEARPGDRVFISYGDLPLRFYTDLDIRGGQGCQRLDGWPPPEWVIVRYFFRFAPSAPAAHVDAERTRQWLAALPWHLYRRIDLGVVDTTWENIPEPDLHVFRPPTDRPRVTIYQKLQPAP